MILEILNFQESFTVWSIESILGDNSRPRNFPDVGFGMESVIITLISGPNEKKFLKAIQNSPFWYLSPNMSKNEFSRKTCLLSAS